ncbi:MAG: DUF2442 domain-containing protein [Chlamydiales bacterium]
MEFVASKRIDEQLESSYIRERRSKNRAPKVTMSHTIKNVEYLDGYRVRLRFDNGLIKIVDLEPMLKKAKNMLVALREVAVFKRVKCDGISIYWPNGVDLCPDLLYTIGKDERQSQRQSRKSKSFETTFKSKMSKRKSPKPAGV